MSSDQTSPPVAPVQAGPSALHTPGPWTVIATHNSFTINYDRPYGKSVENAPVGLYVATIPFARRGAGRGQPVRFYKYAADEANARLIAAAPTMLAVLRGTLGTLGLMADAYPLGSATRNTLEAECAVIRAAIFQATRATKD
jgi:hypothetical protein